MPSLLLKFAATSFLPYRSLGHLSAYFYYSAQITVHQNGQLRLTFFSAIVIFLYQAGHFAYLYQWPSESLLVSFRHADVAYLLLADFPVFCLLTSAVMLQTAYNVYAYYFSPRSLPVNALLEDILVCGKSGFFLVKGKVAGELLITSFRRHYCLLSTAMYQSLIGTDVLFIVSYVYYALHFRSIFPADASYLDHLFTVLLHLPNAVAYWASITSISSTNCHLVISSVLFIRALFTKLRQLLAAISGHHSPIERERGNWSDRKLAFFRRHYTGTLKLFFAGNGHFGRLLLGLIFAHCPANVFMMALLMHGKVPGHSRPFIITISVYQCVSIFGMHLIFAQAIRVLYRPRRVLCSVVAQRGHKGRGSFRAPESTLRRGHLSLSLLVHSFATDARGLIGFTYGPFGRVTMTSFTKYVLLYVKFLLITSKWAKKV